MRLPPGATDVKVIVVSPLSTALVSMLAYVASTLMLYIRGSASTTNRVVAIPCGLIFGYVIFGFVATFCSRACACGGAELGSPLM